MNAGLLKVWGYVKNLVEGILAVGKALPRPGMGNGLPGKIRSLNTGVLVYGERDILHISRGNI